MTGELVAARGVSRAYGPVRAVRDVSLGVRAGEVLALVGHNGAGKSTLTRIVSGAERPDAGRLEIDGAPVTLRSPDDAISRRILLVPQHLSLAPNLTVRENLLLGPWPDGSGSRAGRDRRLAATADEFGLTPLLARRAGTLRPAASRHVMIARAMLRRPRVLILDEPTAMLAGPDTDHLFRVVRDLTAQGCGVLYITHRLAEVLRIADRVAVMRNGALTALEPAAGLDRERLTEWIVGSAALAPEPAADRDRPPAGDAAPARLAVRGLCRGTAVGPVDLDVHAGEIVAVTGLVGSGRTGLLRLVCGVDQPTAGRIALDGRPVRWRGPREAIRAGIAFQPEDRGRNAVIPGLSVAATMLLPLAGSRRRGLVTARREARLARTALARLRVLPENAALLPVGALSGGNQQKALIGRWLLADPAVVVLDEPTEGIDVGSKQEIYRLVEDLAAEGRAVLFASSDLEEVAALAHRVLVLARGRPVAELRPPDLDVETIARACLADPAAAPAPPVTGAAP